MQCADDPVRAVHCALLAAGIVAAGANPLEVGGVAPVDGRLDQLLRQGADRRHIRTADRALEHSRRGRAADRVNIRKVQPKQLIEELVVVGAEIRPIPPKPVAPFRRVYLHPRALFLIGRQLAGLDFFLEEKARLAEQLPRAILLLLTDPDVEVAADPRAGVERGHLPDGRVMREIILDRAAVEPRGIGLDAAIQRAQKRLAAVAECLPRILAVENERDDAAGGDEACDVPHVMEQMAGSLERVVARGHEADEIRERPLAKNRIDRGAVARDAPALEQLEMVDLHAFVSGVAAKRVEEIFLVAAEILDAALRHQRDELGGDGAFAWPEPARAPAEKRGVLLDREREMRGGILGPLKTPRKFPPRQRALGKRRVVHQRQNGMKERRRRELRLAARLGLPVFAQGERDDLEVNI